MTIKKLKQIFEDKFDVNLKLTNRKRHLMYSKKVFVKLAYDINSKHSFQKIADEIDLTHATVLRHYNTVDEVYDKYKVAHDEIIKDYGFPSQLLFYQENNKVIDQIVSMLKTLEHHQLEDLKNNRIKPFIKMALTN